MSTNCSIQHVNLLAGGVMDILSSRWALGLFLIAI